MNKERPILFSGPMVRAILEGRKTQTRRILKPQPRPTRNGWWEWGYALGKTQSAAPRRSVWHADTWRREAGTAPLESFCPYGQPGDRLWVRETWYCDHFMERDYDKTRELCGRDLSDAGCEAEWRGEPRYGGWRNMYYRADGEAHQQFEQLEHPTGRIWLPSIHMPRWASRLALEVTEVRVQRLQEISEEDAVAEGCAAQEKDPVPPMAPTAREQFVTLWDSINGVGAWAANPWVWAISFRRLS